MRSQSWVLPLGMKSFATVLQTRQLPVGRDRDKIAPTLRFLAVLQPGRARARLLAVARDARELQGSVREPNRAAATGDVDVPAGVPGPCGSP